MGVTRMQAVLLLAVALSDLDAARRYARLALGLQGSGCAVRDTDLTVACDRVAHTLATLAGGSQTGTPRERSADPPPCPSTGACPGMGGCVRILADKARERAACCRNGAERASVLLHADGDADARRRMGDMLEAHRALVSLIDRIHAAA